MNTSARLLLLCATAFGGPSVHAQLKLGYAGQVALPGGGEIVSYTKDNFTLATTNFTGTSPASTQGVNLYTFTGSGATFRGTVDLSTIYGRSSTASVSSVALDPLGRGFGVATVIPTANTTVKSTVAVFDYNTGTVLRQVEVGYHADSVTFAQDGSRFVVANEGEANAGTSAANDGSDAPGSISVFSLAGIASVGDVGSLAAPVTTDFTAGNLASGVTLSGVRNPYIAAVGQPGNSAGQQTFIGQVPNFTDPANIDPTGIEPEYAVVHGGKIYVSLQENNAIGVYDPLTGKWERIINLGTINQAVDPTDSDGAPTPPVSVAGLPMPDTLAVVTIGGVNYIVTANEGDARIDDRDATRFGDVAGGDSLNPILDPSLPTTQTGIRSNTQLGRLNLSRIDGDTNGDGKIDTPTMFGTRSFSIWNADTGALVSDSGSLESIVLSLNPSRHNINRENTTIDNRSDDKGPEPEALSVFTLDGLTYAAVGLERQNGILLYNISNPASPVFVDFVNSLDVGLVSPESMLYISGLDSPTGKAYLVAGLEGVDGTGANAGLAVYSLTPVPEPSTYGLMAVGALAAVVIWRRRVQTRRA